jgi:hypothetical protein
MNRSCLLPGLVAAGLAASLLLSVPALASSSSGAAVVRDSTCQPSPDGSFTICVINNFEYNVVTTPSGNSQFQENGSSSLQLTFADGSTGGNSQSVHFHQLLGPNQYEFSSQQTFTFYDSAVQVCVVETSSYHVTSGTVQYARSTVANC